METLPIQLEKRTQTGKGAARKTRLQGRVPGILYGHGQEPVMFDLEGHKFDLALEKSPYGRNQVFSVAGVDRDVQVLIKELQVHPVTRNILHVDFIEVRETDRVKVEVEVKHVGKAVGQSAGGTLQLLKRTVSVMCPPADIPAEIVVDVTPLQIGEDVTVGSLPVAEGVVPLGDPKVVVLTVKPPRVSGKVRDEESEKS